MKNPLPQSVEIFEVGPRDGLQNEPEFIPTKEKIQLVDRLTRAGCKKIEIGSFASPKWVPQLKDTAEVVAAIGQAPGVVYSAFIPNMNGLDRAIETGLGEVVTIISASESHNKKNLNRTIAQSLDELGPLVEKAAAHNVRVRAYVGTSFGCPMEGAVPIDKVVEIAKAMEACGVYEVSLGDTTGMSNPKLTFAVFSALLGSITKASIAAHFHSNKGIEFANVMAALDAGIVVFDGAVLRGLVMAWVGWEWWGAVAFAGPGERGPFVDGERAGPAGGVDRASVEPGFSLGSRHREAERKGVA